jgi:hypothetical protein
MFAIASLIVIIPCIATVFAAPGLMKACICSHDDGNAYILKSSLDKASCKLLMRMCVYRM